LQRIGGHADGVGFGAQGVFHLDVVLLGAENHADEGLVTGAALLVVQEVQIKIHLAGMFGFKWTDLQLEGHQGLEEAVIEKEVDEILLLPQRQPVLAADEAEAVAEFEDEVTQPFDEPFFQCAFLNRPADAEEFQVVRAFEHLIGLFDQVFGQGEIEIVGLFLCYCTS